MPRFVEEVMQDVVVTVTPETSVRDLLKVLVRNQISGAPVVSEAGEIVGVVSTTDVVRLGAREAEVERGSLSWEPLALPNEEYDPESSAAFFQISEDWTYPTEDQAGSLAPGVFDGFSVADIMTRAPETVRASDDILKAVRIFREHRYGALPVLNKDSELVGILSAQDLLGALEELLTS